MRIYYGAGAHAWPSAMPSLTSRSRPRVSLDFFIPCALLTLQYTLNPTLIAAGVGRGAGGRRSARLAERDALADVALAVARQLGLLHAVRVARVQPPLALALALALLPARAVLSSRLRPPQLHMRLLHAVARPAGDDRVLCWSARRSFASWTDRRGAASRSSPGGTLSAFVAWWCTDGERRSSPTSCPLLWHQRAAAGHVMRRPAGASTSAQPAAPRYGCAPTPERGSQRSQQPPCRASRVVAHCALRLAAAPDLLAPQSLRAVLARLALRRRRRRAAWRQGRQAARRRRRQAARRRLRAARVAHCARSRAQSCGWALKCLQPACSKALWQQQG